MKPKSVLAVVVAVLAAGAGFLGGREFERRRGAEETKRVAESHAVELAGLRTQAVSWADAISKGQGEAVLRAFVAGIAPSIRAERRDSLEISAVSLLRVNGVLGIHILRPDGKLLYSSNAKLTTAGEVGEAGAWALAASELVSRAGTREGTLEFVVPLVDAGQVLAVIWMEHAQAAVRDAARPADPATGATTRETEPPAVPPSEKASY